MKTIVRLNTLFILLAVTLTACSPAYRTSSKNLQIANPASENCENVGGTVKFETDGAGGQFGVCHFEDNRQCEEWALFRGECPDGGLDVSGYVTTPARFCAIRGGEYTITGESGAETEQGTCKLPDDTVCDVWELFNAECPK